MTLKVKTEGDYFGYKTSVTITHNNETLTFATANHVDMDYEVTSTDTGEPGTCIVTFYNISKGHRAKIHKNDHLVLKTGPTTLYGKLTAGSITKISPETNNDGDYSFQITFTEGGDYSKDKKIYSSFNGSKLVKKTVKESNGKTVSYTVKKTKKLNITFAKGTHASQIIRRIMRDTGMKITPLDLKHNKVFKKGYTLSAKPLNAVKALAKECGSKCYVRGDHLVIEDGSKPNPYNEHIYFDRANGLLSEPTLNDNDSGKKTYALEAAEDPRVYAGSAIYVKSEAITGLKRVASVTHSKADADYKMEVTIYG
ncbi:hypothetical protein [Lactiplantibacillus daowaiensis]|uniref:Uncharacterized protein n=1 Tax=Lactiplantibacillus daowaiensis TaxID=2559918 RepID=A0ABW1RY22_9LACO|nr:hypothetical protein [Lactiplantibacillus daowaiensis]